MSQSTLTSCLGTILPCINSGTLVSFRADNGLLWCSTEHSSVGRNIEAAGTSRGQWSQFRALLAPSGKLLLQDLRGVYLSRINWGGVGGVDSIMAAKAEADVYCEFEVFTRGEYFVFRADNGKFLCRNPRQGKENIEDARDDPDSSCNFLLCCGGPADVEPQTATLTSCLGTILPCINSGTLVSFRADNGLLWCSTEHSSVGRNIEAAGTSRGHWSQFRALLAPSGKLLLQDLRGVYLSRINWGGVGGVDSIMAAKAEADVYCEFEVFTCGEYFVFRADNGKFLCRNPRQGKENIEAARDDPDSSCNFLLCCGGPADVEPQTATLTSCLGTILPCINSGTLVSFRADNGLLWCSTEHSSVGRNIEAAGTSRGQWSQFRALLAPSGKLLLQDLRGVYLSRINWGGVGGVDSIMAAKAEADVYCGSPHTTPRSC
ncbi:uncharacterized protein [Lepisosteus oculatus]|uniref:uncharacterized protein isoform X2 n=1 Tax=Lepisosteus oculatus TaxID=7918 RepID=UPI0035F521E8